MEMLTEVISGIVSGVLATAVITVAVAVWRKRLLRKYALSNEARQVLEVLWDENLLRRSQLVAKELNLDEAIVLDALQQLQQKKLVRKRIRNNGNFWKITLRGKEYLRQSLWIE